MKTRSIQMKFADGSERTLWNRLTGGSVWTDMVDEMQSQTAAALGNIVSDFQGLFGSVALSVPVARAAVPERFTEPQPVSAIVRTPQSITLQNVITLDGQVIARTVKKILVEQRQYGERSVGRLT